MRKIGIGLMVVAAAGVAAHGLLRPPQTSDWFPWMVDARASEACWLAVGKDVRSRGGSPDFSWNDHQLRLLPAGVTEIKGTVLLELNEEPVPHTYTCQVRPNKVDFQVQPEAFRPAVQAIHPDIPEGMRRFRTEDGYFGWIAE